MLFLPWSTTAGSAQELRSALIDHTLETKFSRPLSQVRQEVLHKVATPFVVSNLPFDRTEDTVLILLKIANVKCFGMIATPNGEMILWIAHEDVQRFQRHNCSTLLCDTEGWWIAQSDFAVDVLACSCPGKAVAVSVVKNTHTEITSNTVPAPAQKTTASAKVGRHLGGSQFQLVPSNAQLPTRTVSHTKQSSD